MEGKTVDIFELGNTFGCAWRDRNGKESFGFNGFESGTKLWLEVTSGNAVENLLEVGIGEVIEVERGFYGGKKRTLRVNLAELDAVCRAHWDRINAKKVDRSRCHYCGLPAVGEGFFGEPTCNECGG